MNCLIEKNKVQRSVPNFARFVVLVSGLALGATSYARAADYYISNSEGNDSNSGTSPDAPWKSLSKVYPKSISKNPFVAGDSIRLKAGDIFSGTLSLTSGSAGTESSPITVSRYGAGANPIIYGDNANITWSSVPGHPGVYSAIPAGANTIQSVYDINGNKYTRLDQGTDTLNVWLDKFTANNWGFSFDTPNLIYVRTPDDNPPPSMRVIQYCAIRIGGNYVRVENLDIRRGHMGIVVNVARGFVFRNNSIEDMQGTGIYGGVKCSYGEIANNTITRTGWTSLYSSTCQNLWIHHNTISHAQDSILGIAVNGKELCGIGLERGVNNLVEHNSISYVEDSFFDYWLEVGSIVRYNYGFHSGGAAYPTGTGLKVHNNLFNVDGGAGIGGGHSHDPVLSPASDAGPNLIYNNVIYNFTRYGLYSGEGKSAGTIFRNNLLVSTTPVSRLVLMSSGIDSDYNHYFCTGGATSGWNWNNQRYATLAAFQKDSGQEAHSVYVDPQFVSAIPVTSADFKLRSTSPSIDAGQDLKRVGLLPRSEEYKDFLGAFIPAGSAPDIGAYEYGASAIAPSDSYPGTYFLPFKNVFNPTKGETIKVNYNIPAGAEATLIVYDRKGREITTLAVGPNIDTIWDGRNNQGSVVASGIYFLILKVDGETQTQKIVVVK